MTDGPAGQILGVYCERGFDAAFWAEPVNAVTNLGFVAAGVAMAARSGEDRTVRSLAFVAIAIGAGSFAFHTLATRWAMIADVAPIQVFIALYFFFAMRRFFGFGAIPAIGVTIVFLVAASAGPALLPREEPWRGLGGYVGGFAGLVGVGSALVARGGEGRGRGRALLGVAALFGLSLGFRTADLAVCGAIPIGSHGLWHLANALVLLTLMEILRRPRREFGRIDQ